MRHLRRTGGPRGRHHTDNMVIQNFDSACNGLTNYIVSDTCVPLMQACLDRCTQLRPEWNLNTSAIEDISRFITTKSVYIPPVLYSLVDGIPPYSSLHDPGVIDRLADWARVPRPKVDSGGILSHIPAAKEQIRKLVRLPLAKLRYLYQTFPTIFTTAVKREEWIRDASSPGTTSRTRLSYSDLNLVAITINSLLEVGK